MNALADTRADSPFGDGVALPAFHAKARDEWSAFAALGLRLDMSRGKPSPDQLALATPLLGWSAAADYVAADGTDCRNYGGLAGLAELRALFGEMLGIPGQQVVVAGNSSLELMYGVIAAAMTKGVGFGSAPWAQCGEIAFLCPVPGYDRHFRICEEFGIRMVSVPMCDDGPAIDEVEKLVADDASIKGMWCMPKYSNPTGVVYSAEVIRRLAAMPTAATDFRLFWDNAYAMHHLTDDEVKIEDIVSLCAAAGNTDRPLVFTSTSKITLAGAGIAAFASSPDNVRWWLERSAVRTIGPDKLNQLRHVHFLGDMARVRELMRQHHRILAPKFSTVDRVFDRHLARFGIARWTRPAGGYFISLNVPEGCARRTVALAAEAGIVLTPAGATFPYGHDPRDANIRIAPSYPTEEDVELAAEGIALSVLFAATEHALHASGQPA